MKVIFLAIASLMISIGAFAQTDSTMNRNQNDINNANPKTKPVDMNQHHDGNHSNDSQMHGTQPTIKTQPADKTQVDGFRMEKGKLMRYNSGKSTLVEREMTFNDGSRLMSNGTIVRKDGSKLVIKDDEYVDLTGNIVKSNRSKDMYLVPDSTKN